MKPCFNAGKTISRSRRSGEWMSLLNWSDLQPLLCCLEALRTKGARPHAFLRGAWVKIFLQHFLFEAQILSRRVYEPKQCLQTKFIYQPVLSNDQRLKVLSFCLRAFACALHSASNFLLPFSLPSSELTTLTPLVFTQLPLLLESLPWSPRLV